jgi:hypothetical protein
MRGVRVLSPFVLLLIASVASSQVDTNAVARDPQAISILTGALNAAGGASAVAAIQSYSADGTVNYFWAGQEVQGTVTIRSGGLDRFRLDATLPEGLRSLVANHGGGFVKEWDGREKAIPYPVAVSLGANTLPLLHLLAALQDSSTSIRYAGLLSYSEQQAYEIRIRRHYSSNDDPSGQLGRLTEKTVFIEQGTLQVIGSRDAAYMMGNASVGQPHELEFSNFKQVGGIVAPFSITESLEGQRTMVVQLNQITFNANFADSDFQP